jgi:hypothetical protein
VLMFWSDATHLATFGTAKLWPIYLLFGNLSKYVRCQPDSGATKHVAYIPPLPDLLQDELKSFHQKWDTQHKDILTHCRCELMHRVWAFLLDEDFQHAYKYGIVVQGQDWIERHVYPRIVTYSADYPEKFVLNFSLQLVPLLTSLVGYCWPLSMIRAFAHAPVVWSQNRSSISLELIKIQATGSARHASTMASLFMRLEDQYMNLGWRSMVPQFSVSSRPPQPSLCW